MLCLALVSLSPSADAADGDLDLSFGPSGTGIVRGDIGTGMAVAIQSDSKILVASGSGRLARFTPEGFLDLTFGPDGTGLIGISFSVYAVAIQNQRIVVAGSTGGDFALARFLYNGTLDLTFGPARTGIVTIPLSPPPLTAPVANRGCALAVQPDGKIVVAATAAPDIQLARYTFDGSLDLTFGPSRTGTVVTDFAGGYDFATSIAVQADGKIVAAGYSGDNFSLVRYTPDGLLDVSFGPSGTGRVVTFFVGFGFGFAYGVAIQSDGKIVAAGTGYYQSPTNDNAIALARYNMDGTLDLSFGPNGTGLILTPSGGFCTHLEAFALALQSDGKIVVAGVEKPCISDEPATKFALARYSVNGLLDGTFGGTGIVTTDIADIQVLPAGFYGYEEANAVTIQEDGKILSVGWADVEWGGRGMAMARYLSTSPDTTPPGGVTTLTAGSPTANSVPLTWTAPGDDVNTWTAMTYDIRYGTVAMSEANWGSATQAVGEPAPLPAGSAQSFTVTGLACSTLYYFALKTADEVPNWSALSNVVSQATSPCSTVTIDIKPGGFPNSINPKSRGKIPVAILSSPTFDAPAQVDRGSLTFGRTGDEPSLAFCTSGRADVNGDGRPDLVCHFHTPKAAFQTGDTEGVLKGKTIAAIPFSETDSVRIVPPR
jgi:uncharacterized delta-60 repeat protein